MLKVSKKIGYSKWDCKDFIIPKEFILKDSSTISDALKVFYAAGGYNFFKVVDPEKYASNWLDFVSILYTDIEDGKYKSDGTHYTIPLSDVQRNSLVNQGVPKIFTTDF